MVGEAQLDWLVRGRKGNRPGLSPPLGTSSAESGGEARKQEVARGALEGPEETVPFPWETAGNVCLQHASQAAG